MIAQQLRFEADLENTRVPQPGKIIVKTDVVQKSNKVYKFEFVWPNCGNVVGKCCGQAAQKVRFEFFRQVGEGWIKTFTTPLSDDMATPYSGPIRIPLSVLCNSDMEV